LRRFHKKNPSENKNVIEVADLHINKEQFIVQRKGQEDKISLAKKEFELLCLLASKPGKVFTREEIFNKIWGSNVIVGNRTIDVHIRKIREKVGEGYIKTIKGIGYKFEF
jgi:two-component system alkaline phosphatase synthesis response regulator PhoP